MDENDQEIVDEAQSENYQEEYATDRNSNVSGDASPRSEDGEIASNSPIRSPDNEYPDSPNNEEFENPDEQELNASKSPFRDEDIGSPCADGPRSPVSPGSDAGDDHSRSSPTGLHSPFDGNQAAGPDSPNSPVEDDVASPPCPGSPQSPVHDGGIASPESPHRQTYSPRSPVCSIPHSPLSATSSNQSRRSHHSVLNDNAAELRQHSSPAGERNEGRDHAESPTENRSRSASPDVNRSRSLSGSLSGSRNSSLSPTRDGSVHSRSPAGSPARSHNSSPARSVEDSPSRSRSGLPAGSPIGSPYRSHSGSPARSRSVSPIRSRSGSPARGQSASPIRSRSGSPARSRSASPIRSRSGSPARSRSASPMRSRSGSPARSRSVSPVHSRSVSPVRSKSGSPARSGSGSPVIHRKKRNRLSGSDRSRSNSPGVASNRSRSGSPGKSSKKDEVNEDAQPLFENDSDNEGSDKGSAVGELIADIFGSSDEEEFEGFGNEPDVESAAKKDKKKKQKDATEEVLPDLSDDDDVDASGKRHAPDFVSDFDLMLEKKKEEMRKRRRKRKDVDIINDNDDLIDDMIRRMKMAAEDDRNLNQQKKPAVKKLGMLPKILPQLKKADLHNAFLDGGILNAITEWLAPLPDKSLPHLQIREAMLRQLMEFPSISTEGLKMSGIGKAVMYLYKHPREIRTNKEMAGKLINEWSRPIFNLTSNYKNLSRQEREERDYEQLPKKRRISLEGATPRRDIDKALTGEEKVLRPGDPGYVYRARVPQPSVRDYVIRPKWNIEEKTKGSGKKQVTKYEKHVRAQKRKSTTMKMQRAVPMSIEGRNMSL